MKELNISLVDGVLTINGQEVDYIKFTNGQRLHFPTLQNASVSIQTGDMKGNKNIISRSSIKCGGNFRLGDG